MRDQGPIRSGAFPTGPCLLAPTIEAAWARVRSGPAPRFFNRLGPAGMVRGRGSRIGAFRSMRLSSKARLWRVGAAALASAWVGAAIAAPGQKKQDYSLGLTARTTQWAQTQTANRPM